MPIVGLTAQAQERSVQLLSKYQHEVLVDIDEDFNAVRCQVLTADSSSGERIFHWFASGQKVQTGRVEVGPAGKHHQQYAKHSTDGTPP